MKIKNKAVIRALARKQLLGQKTRNILLLGAIFLATFMLTSVCRSGIIYYHSLAKSQLSLNGSDYDGMLMGPSEEQVAIAKKLPQVKAVGIGVGSVTLVEYQEIPISTVLIWADKTHWKQQLLPAFEVMEGTYPKNKNDVVLSKKALDKMGIMAPKLGMKLPLKFAAYDGMKTEEFVLSGYFNDYSDKNRGFVSKGFQNEYGTSMDDLERGKMYISFDTPFISKEDIKKMDNQLMLRDYQGLYADTEQGKQLLQFLAAVGGLICLIMLSAYLLIYNILYISISKEIRYYRLLKTVGTTKKQLKNLVYLQLFYLSLVGIITGLVAGGAVSQLFLPTALQRIFGHSFSIAGGVFSGLPVYLLAVSFSLLTVFISTYKPAKLAGEVSSIEAVNYEGQEIKRKRYVSKQGSKIHRMALRNIFRKPKQGALVILSLFVGVTSFMAAATVLSGNEADRILNALEVTDMNLINKTSGAENQEQQFSAELVEKLRKVAGVKAVFPTTVVSLSMERQELFQEFYEQVFDRWYRVSLDKGYKMMTEKPEDFRINLIGIEEEIFDRLVKKQKLTVNKASFLSGEVGLLGSVPMMDKVLVPLRNKEIYYPTVEGSAKLLIGGILAGHRSVPSAQYSEFYPEMLVANDFLKKAVEEGRFSQQEKTRESTLFIDHLSIEYEKPYNSVVDKEIIQLVKENRKIDYESKLLRYKNMKKSEAQLLLIGSLISFVLALLGIINYINLITTAITSRAKEFGILRSVGMTRKQLRQLVLLEGALYGGISLFLVSTAGVLITYGIYSLMNDYQLPFQLPWRALSGIYLTAFAICLVVPLLFLNRTQKNSLIHQIQKE